MIEGKGDKEQSSAKEENVRLTIETKCAEAEGLVAASLRQRQRAVRRGGRIGDGWGGECAEDNI